jgi:hypothetical protein
MYFSSAKVVIFFGIRKYFFAFLSAIPPPLMPDNQLVMKDQKKGIKQRSKGDFTP